MNNVLLNLLPYYILLKNNYETILVVSLKNFIFLLNCLKNHIGYQYNLLSCISCVDLLNKKYRFCVVYDLLSLTFNSRIRIKIFINEILPVPTATFIFLNANWWEREVWDLYGVYFENHPDLRRILTDYGFEGYPLRKDFPLYGYFEIKYDNKKKSVVIEPVELSQEFRIFNFDTPW